jgi:hypothetical protein
VLLQIMLWSLPLMFLLELFGRVSSTLHLERRFAWLMPVHGLLSVTLIVVFVRAFGVTGAAVTVIASRLLLLAMSSWAVGPAVLWDGIVDPLVRVCAAAVAMAVVVAAAHTVVPGTGFVPLMLLVVAGALVYTAAAVLLRVVTVAEVRTIAAGMRRRLATE